MAAKKAAPKKKALSPAQKKRAQLQRAERAEGIKREKFCQLYVLTQNATQSYLEAFSTTRKPITEPSAATGGWRLLRNVEISQRVKELRIEHHDALMVSFEETLQEIGNLSMFDPVNMFDEDGRLLQLHEMDPVTRKMVNEIEISIDDDDNPLRMAKIKYGKDKRGYLDMVMKYRNAYNDHQKAGTGVIIVQQYCAQDANL